MPVAAAKWQNQQLGFLGTGGVAQSWALARHTLLSSAKGQFRITVEERERVLTDHLAHRLPLIR